MKPVYGVGDASCMARQGLQIAIPEQSQRTRPVNPWGCSLSCAHDPNPEG
jgi:hypothetical protein